MIAWVRQVYLIAWGLLDMGLLDSMGSTGLLDSMGSVYLIAWVT